MATGTNLVIQQVGDIGRLQQITQKTGELQQQAAALAQQEKAQEERSQVTQGEAAGRSKINQDERQKQREREAKSRPRSAAKPAGPGSGPAPDGKGALDIIV
jgi:hypothetical protein